MKWSSDVSLCLTLAATFIGTVGCASNLTRQAWKAATEPRPARAQVTGTVHDDAGMPTGLVVRYAVRGEKQTVRTLVIPVDADLHAVDPYRVDYEAYRAIAFSRSQAPPYERERVVLARPQPDRTREVSAAAQEGRFRAVNAPGGIGMTSARVGNRAGRAAPFYYSTVPEPEWKRRPDELADSRRYALVPGTVPRPFEGLESAGRVTGTALATPMLLIADGALTAYWYVGMSIAGATGAFGR
jgi:hypothetical protein